MRGVLEEGFRCYEAGQLTKAEQIFRHVLAIDPRHADALHLLGLIALQVGQNERAVEIIRKAIEIRPTNAVYYSNLGTALQELDRIEDAISAFDTALRLKPDYATAYYNMGNSLRDLDRLEEAISAYNAAIRFKPDYADAHYNRGTALQKLGRLEEAIVAFNASIRLKPDYADAHYNRGTALQKLGHLEEAIVAFNASIRLKPDYADAHYSRGVALRSLDRLEEAISAYTASLSLKPDLAEAHADLGSVLHDLDRLEEAFVAFNTALHFKPDLAEAHCNLGAVLHDLGRLEDAIVACNTALHFKPDLAEAHCNLGGVLDDLGRLEDAITAYNIALHFKPDLAKAHFNRGLALLSSGDLSNGWTEYEWRLRGGAKGLKPHGFSEPQWQGEALNGRTILLHAEQGLGDTIQFCRYATLVAARGGRVILQTPRALLRLLSGLPGVERLIATGEPLPAYDFHCPLMSLPHIFGTSLATIPAPLSYIQVEEVLRSKWQSRLSPTAGRRVGLVWAGNPKYKKDRDRSLPFAALAPLWNIPGIRWYSLQVGGRRANLDAAPPGIIEDLSPALDDFAETAAAISQLDLVLTSDTSVAHLAGALGRPTWVMLSFAPDWRWLTKREDSPWYPSVRLFRQTERGEWGNVIQSVAAAFAGKLVNQH